MLYDIIVYQSIVYYIIAVYYSIVCWYSLCYVCDINIYIYIYIFIYTHIHICIYIYICDDMLSYHIACTCEVWPVRTSRTLPVWMDLPLTGYLDRCLCVYIYIYIYMYTCVYIYIYIYIYTHTCIYKREYLFRDTGMTGIEAGDGSGRPHSLIRLGYSKCQTQNHNEHTKSYIQSKRRHPDRDHLECMVKARTKGMFVSQTQA